MGVHSIELLKANNCACNKFSNLLNLLLFCVLYFVCSTGLFWHNLLWWRISQWWFIIFWAMLFWIICCIICFIRTMFALSKNWCVIIEFYFSLVNTDYMRSDLQKGSHTFIWVFLFKYILVAQLIFYLQL